MQYDLVIVGGGLGGSALGIAGPQWSPCAAPGA